MKTRMENEMETGIIWGIIGVRVYTPSMPLNNPYSSPIYNPLCNPPLRSLDYGSNELCGL